MHVGKQKYEMLPLVGYVIFLQSDEQSWRAWIQRSETVMVIKILYETREDGEKMDNLESKHGLKPGKKICIGLLVVFLGPWQTSGVAKSMESSLDLHNT